MKKPLDAEELVGFFVSEVAQRSGVELVMFRQVYAYYRKDFQCMPLSHVLAAVLKKVQKPLTSKRTGVIKRSLVFLMKVLVSERLGVAIPDFQSKDVKRWISWGEQVFAWLIREEVKTEKVL
jgi:hypothetical protein